MKLSVPKVLDFSNLPQKLPEPNIHNVILTLWCHYIIKSAQPFQDGEEVSTIAVYKTKLWSQNTI